MSFRMEDGVLRSTRPETDYHVETPFQRVLQTLSGEEVPRAMVMLGILTEQLDPIGSEADRHIRTVSEHVDEAPATAVPEATVRSVMWLLNEVRPSLDSERKRTIGTLITESTLNVPATNHTVQPDTTPSKSTETTDQSHETDAVETADTADRPDTTATGPAETQPREAIDTPDDVEDAALTCEFCDDRLPTESTLRAHTIRCPERPDEARFQCDHCGNEYVSEWALNKHLDECDDVRSAERDRATIRTTADGTAVYTCDTCGEAFDTGQQLIEHRQPTLDCTKHPSTRRSESTVVERGATGAVVHFDSTKGYGFILSSDFIQLQDSSTNSSDDLFFHVSEYPGGSVSTGEQLRFDIAKEDDEFQAVNISRIQQKRIEPWNDTFASMRPRWGRDS